MDDLEALIFNLEKFVESVEIFADRCAKSAADRRADSEYERFELLRDSASVFRRKVPLVYVRTRPL